MRRRIAALTMALAVLSGCGGDAPDALGTLEQGGQIVHTGGQPAIFTWNQLWADGSGAKP